MSAVHENEARRRQRLRYQIRLKAHGRPRLSVFRSGKHIYAQVIDDVAGRTIVSASTVEKNVRDQLDHGNTVEAAQLIGKLVAERAMEKGIRTVVFDRGGYLYHGRIQALADAAREVGLDF